MGEHLRAIVSTLEHLNTFITCTIHQEVNFIKLNKMDIWIIVDFLLTCYYSAHIKKSITGYYHIMEPVHIFEIRYIFE